MRTYVLLLSNIWLFRPAIKHVGSAVELSKKKTDPTCPSFTHIDCTYRPSWFGRIKRNDKEKKFTQSSLY